MARVCGVSPMRREGVLSTVRLMSIAAPVPAVTPVTAVTAVHVVAFVRPMPLMTRCGCWPIRPR